MSESANNSGGGQPAKKPRKGSPLFVKGDPRAGRKLGVKNKITERKIELIANTGMMPVDFFAFVMRDQLYSDYEEVPRPGVGTTKVFRPKKDAKRTPVNLAQRLQAGNSLAPYVHKRMPIAIEGTDKPLTFIDAGKLAQLKPDELDAFIELMTKLGVGGMFAGPGTKPPEAGTL